MPSCPRAPALCARRLLARARRPLSPRASACRPARGRGAARRRRQRVLAVGPVPAPRLPRLPARPPLSTTASLCCTAWRAMCTRWPSISSPSLRSFTLYHATAKSPLTELDHLTNAGQIRSIPSMDFKSPAPEAHSPP